MPQRGCILVNTPLFDVMEGFLIESVNLGASGLVHMKHFTVQ